jgi:hypothetical protein
MSWVRPAVSGSADLSVKRRLWNAVRRPLRGPATILRAVYDGLPFNLKLAAFNVAEVPVPPGVVEAARDFYDSSVALRLDTKDSLLTCGDSAFYVARRPDWGSDIAWWSADDERTFSRFQALFDQLAPALAREGVLRPDAQMFCGFFITRSYSSRAYMHEDYAAGVGTGAYTLMTPIDDWSGPDGQLRYVDVLGRTRTYTYRKGRAIVLGAGFVHGTGECAQAGRAFLCFTFGSTDSRVWPTILSTIRSQSRLLSGPGRVLQYDAPGDAPPSASM